MFLDNRPKEELDMKSKLESRNLHFNGERAQCSSTSSLYQVVILKIKRIMTASTGIIMDFTIQSSLALLHHSDIYFTVVSLSNIKRNILNLFKKST